MINYIIDFFRGSKKRGPPSVHRRVSSRVDLTPELNASHQEQNRIASERMKKRVDSYLDSLALTKDVKVLDETINEMNARSKDIVRTMLSAGGVVALQSYINEISRKAEYLRNPIPFSGEGYASSLEGDWLDLHKSNLTSSGKTLSSEREDKYRSTEKSNRRYASQLAEKLGSLVSNIQAYGRSEISYTGKSRLTGAETTSQLFKALEGR